MRARALVGFIFLVAVSISLIACSDATAQRFKTKRIQSNSPANHHIVRRANHRHAVRPISSRLPDASYFRRASYKVGSEIPEHEMPRSFSASNFQWDQPDGPGSAITVTYSYSNLLDGDVRGLSVQQLRQATEEAMGLWAEVAPINFVEVEDSGPDPADSESNYIRGSAAQIRIGAHEMDGPGGGELAHAFLPYSNSSGLAGDLHFDVDEDWSFGNGGFFLETMLHELGHTLGLEHVDGVDAIMNPLIMSRFSGLGTGFLLDDDIAGIQFVYGSGVGSVTPRQQEEEDPQDPDSPTEEVPEANNDFVAEFDEETGLVRLQGDAMDNSVLVYSNRWFSIVLGFEETTINGERGAFWMQMGDKPIEIATGDGADTVYLYGVSANSANCDLGSGDDTMVVIFSRIESLTANAGEGEDRLLEIFNRIGDLVESGFETVW